MEAAAAPSSRIGTMLASLGARRSEMTRGNRKGGGNVVY